MPAADRHVPMSGRQELLAAAVAVAFVLLATSALPVHAAVPIVQGAAVGAEGGVGIFQLFEAGFTDVSATSSNADVA